MTRPFNNNASINSQETATLITVLGEPFLSSLALPDGDKETVSLRMLDPAVTHDRKIYETLANDTENFEILSQTEHGGRYSVLMLIHYRRKTDTDVPPSYAEMRMAAAAKPVSKAKKKTARKGKPAKKKTSGSRLGFTVKKD